MVAASRTLLVLLAAGRSTRFGDADKLAAMLAGKPLARHAVDALAPIAFLGRVAVVSGTAIDFAAWGYRPILNPAPEDGLSASVRLGAAAAREAGAAAALIVLADMPRISAGHVSRLLHAARTADDVVASADGDRTSPPALFAAGRFADLMGVKGDEGGRALIRGGIRVPAPADTLVDIDTPEDLARLSTLPA